MSNIKVTPKKVKPASFADIHDATATFDLAAAEKLAKNSIGIKGYWRVVENRTDKKLIIYTWMTPYIEWYSKADVTRTNADVIGKALALTANAFEVRDDAANGLWEIHAWQ